MRRRCRIDLGQEVSSKEAARLDRKRQKWIATNKGRPESENPFLVAIKPGHENYGEPDEVGGELKARLENLEFGNFPGYFNYRNNAASEAKSIRAESDGVKSGEPRVVGNPNVDSRNESELQNIQDNQSIGNSPTVGSRAKTSTTTTNPSEDEIQRNQEANPLQAGLSDERIKLMRSEWFAGKDVLDIGCNRGHITYAIGRLFSPKFILGIDIDLKMVQMANRDLHLHLEEGLLRQSIEFRRARAERLRLDGCKGVSGVTGPGEQAEIGDKLLYSEDEDHFPLASYISHGPLAVASSSQVTLPDDERERKNNFPSQREAAGVGEKQPDDNKPLDPCSLSTSASEPADAGDCGASKPLGMSSSPACDDGDKMEKTSSGEMVSSPTTTTATTQASQLPGSQSRPCNLFPNNILFVEHNYVPANDELVEKQRAFFDTIVCLSVTKWIHLNYRDSGLERFFKRIYKHLRPDGVLILEAQPFDNYGRRKKLSDRLRANYYSIKLKPEQFDEYLLGPQIGFRRILYSTTTDHECAGFKRPLKVFQK